MPKAVIDPYYCGPQEPPVQSLPARFAMVAIRKSPTASPAPRPPAFAWDDWYRVSRADRSIRIDEVDDYLRRIYDDQSRGFKARSRPPAARSNRRRKPPAILKEKALEFGADIVGICEIEPSDVYRGRTITDTHAIAVGQRMRWREFQVVPSRESAIECLRVYFTLGETVIQLAAYIRSLGYACKVEHPDRRLRPPAHSHRTEGRLRRARTPRIDHSSQAGSALPDGKRHHIDSACRSITRSTPASQSSATPAVPAGSSAPRTPFRTSEARRPGKDHLGYDRYVVDTGRCFPYFAKHNYCSICLPVCVYNHKEWARDFERLSRRSCFQPWS